MADVWYPAESGEGPAALYLDAPAYERVLGLDRLKGTFGAAYEAVRAGLIRTHARERAPFARSAKQCPVLIFSHGGGLIKEIYTAQLEDLASHGYIVAALAHPYDSMLTVFPGGRSIPFDGNRWPRVASEEADPDRLQWLADDFRFVLTELERMNRANEVGLPFAGHADLTRVGAFGHSQGGQAAARACQTDRRLQACLNQDGLSRFAPFYLDDRGWGMDQAFLLMARAPRKDSPSDEEIAAMRMTRVQVEELVARLKARQDAVLRATGGGSYRVLLSSNKTTHMDFSDLPILQSRTRNEAVERERILSLVRTCTRGFFDHALRKLNRFPGDIAGVDVVESVETFPAVNPPHIVP